MYLIIITMGGLQRIMEIVVLLQQASRNVIRASLKQSKMETDNSINQQVLQKIDQRFLL